MKVKFGVSDIFSLAVDIVLPLKYKNGTFHTFRWCNLSPGIQ